jgi:hypothetical protein
MNQPARNRVPRIVVHTPSDIRNVETVFRRGLAFDASKLRASVKGLVGLR